MTHAFFKGLLFRAAVRSIPALGGEQDMRRMGGCAAKFLDMLDDDAGTSLSPHSTVE